MLREIKFKSEYDLAGYLPFVHNFNVNTTPARVIRSAQLAEARRNKYKERHVSRAHK